MNEERMFFRVDAIPVSEEWITDAIRRAGGIRILDKFTFPDGVENCDYAFGNDVFIELKILEKDSFEAPERQAKLLNFFEEMGFIAEAGVSDVDSSQLDQAAKKRFYEIVYGSLEPLIKKANSQIKATAKFLEVDKFHGVVFLVNKECETIEAEHLRNHAQYLIARKKCSSLHHAITFSSIPALAKGSRPVIGMRVGEGHPVLEPIFARIRDALKEQVQEALGKTLDNAPSDLGPLTNLRDHRSFTKGGTTVTLFSPTRDVIDENLELMKRRPKQSPQ